MCPSVPLFMNNCKLITDKLGGLAAASPLFQKQTRQGETWRDRKRTCRSLTRYGTMRRQTIFKTKNKIYELILYTGPELEQFPRAQRRLAEEIRETMLQILRLVVTLENKHYKKTTLGELDNEVDVLRHLVRLAADPQYTRSRKPCLPLRKYENISRKINEIGCMIGGYYKSLKK